MNHCNAEMARGEGIGWMNFLATQEEFAGIGCVNSGENFAQRAFACAIFSDQGMTGAFFDFKTNVVECEDTRKTFCDVLKSNKSHTPHLRCVAGCYRKPSNCWRRNSGRFV